MAVRTAYPGTAVAGVLTVANVNNLPGGWIGYVSITADSNTWNTTATAITGLSVTVTVNTSRRIRITASAVLETGGSAAVTDIYLWRDNGGASPVALTKRRWGGGSGLAQATFTIVEEDHPSAGSHTYSLFGDRVTGSANQYVTASTDGGNGYGPAILFIEDLGPQ